MRMRWTVEERVRFATRWVQFRKTRNLSQEEMASALGISVQKVKQIEGGRMTPSETVVMKFGELEKIFREGKEIEALLKWVPGKGGKV